MFTSPSLILSNIIWKSQYFSFDYNNCVLFISYELSQVTLKELLISSIKIDINLEPFKLILGLTIFQCVIITEKYFRNKIFKRRTCFISLFSKCYAKVSYNENELNNYIQ